MRKLSRIRLALTRFVLAALTLSGLSMPVASAKAQDVSPTVTLAPNSSYGMVLTDPDGWTLYTWDGDEVGMSNCSASCSDAWPAFISSADDLIAPANLSGTLGWIDRGDGTWQVSIDGWPLYYFSGDTAPGVVAGDGSMGFGARWYVEAFAPPSTAALPPAPIAQPAPVEQPLPVAQPPTTNPLTATPDASANTQAPPSVDSTIPNMPPYPGDMSGLVNPPPPLGFGGPMPPPGIPGGFNPTLTVVVPPNGTVALNWLGSPNAQAYRIYDTIASQPMALGVAQTVTQSLGFLATNTVVTGLAPGQTYMFQVRAVDATGAETPAPAAANGAAVGGPVGVPGPTSLALTASTAGTATLNWVGIGGARSYLILQATNPNAPFTPSAMGPISATSATVTGLALNTPYFFEVVAIDQFGNETLPSNIISLNPNPAAALSAFLSVGAMTATTANLSWTPISGATEYQIQMSNNQTGPFSVAGRTNQWANSVTITGLMPATNYFFQLVALDMAGNPLVTSSPAIAMTASTGDPVATLAMASPTSLVAKSTTASTVTLSWLASPGATSYTVLQSTNGGQFGLSNTTNMNGTSATVIGLSPNTTYSFEVVAIGPSGRQSAPSNVIVGITTSALASPGP